MVGNTVVVQHPHIPVPLIGEEFFAHNQGRSELVAEHGGEAIREVEQRGHEIFLVGRERKSLPPAIDIVASERLSPTQIVLDKLLHDVRVFTRVLPKCRQLPGGEQLVQPTVNSHCCGLCKEVGHTGSKVLVIKPTDSLAFAQGATS